MKKRIISLILAIIMVVGLLPTVVLAAPGGPQQPTANITADNFENCEVVYIEGNKLTEDASYQTFASESQINKTFTAPYAFIFFVKPEEGYALTNIGAENGKYFYTISDGDTVDDCAFMRYYENPMVQGGVATRNLVDNKIVANKETLKGIISAARDKGYEGAFYYSKSAKDSGGIGPAKVYVYTEKLPTLEKSIVSVKYAGSSGFVAYEPGMKVSAGDTIKYRFTVTFAKSAQKSGIEYSKITITDEKLDYTEDISAPSSGTTVVKEQEYVVQPTDVVKNGELQTTLVNTAELSYQYHSKYSDGVLTDSVTNQVSITVYPTVEYQYTFTGCDDTSVIEAAVTAPIDGDYHASGTDVTAKQHNSTQDVTDTKNNGKWVLTPTWSYTDENGETKTVDPGDSFTMPNVAAGTSLTLTATWTFVPNGATLSINKALDGDMTSAGYDYNLSITVTKLDENNEETDQTYTLTQGEGAARNMFTLTGATLPTGKYVVKEIGAPRDGYTMTAKLEDSDQTPGHDHVLDTSAMTFKVEEGDTSILLKLVNTYTRIQASTATKTVVCANDADKPASTDLNTSANITYPTRTGSTINPIPVAGLESVTLLYKITVTGAPGAAFTIYEEGNWEIVNDGNITGLLTANNKTHCKGNLPERPLNDDGETVTGYFYLIRTFTITSETTKLSNTITMNNTSDTEEVPVVHPMEFDLNGKIKKTLVDGDKVPAENTGAKYFEAAVVPAVKSDEDGTEIWTLNGELISGTADFKTGSDGTKDFEFANKRTFETVGTYTYIVYEGTPDSTNPMVYSAGMIYDAHTYLLTITVKLGTDGKLMAEHNFLELVKVTGENSQFTVATDAQSLQTITFTNTYVEQEASLTLSSLFQKKLESNVPLDQIPDNLREFTLHIQRITSGGFHTAVGVTGKAAINETAKNEATGKYEGTSAFEGFKEGDVYVSTNPDVPALTFSAAGTYQFEVSEDNGGKTINGMTYADKLVMTVVVAQDQTTKELNIASAKVGKPQTLSNGSYDMDEENHLVKIVGEQHTLFDGDDYTPYTIVNSYTAPTVTGVEKRTLTGYTNNSVINAAMPEGTLFPSGDPLTLTVDRSVNSVTLAYAVTITGEPGATATVTDPGADYIGCDDFASGEIKPNEDKTEIKVTFASNGTATLYFTKTFTRGEDGKFATAKNIAVVNNSDVPSEETTIEEHNPASYDFSNFIEKELKITGSESFTGAEFKAVLKLEKFEEEEHSGAEALALNALAEPKIVEHHEDAWTIGTTYDLYAVFDASAADEDYPKTLFLTRNGEHLVLDFPAAGTYTFTLEEVDEGLTGVTYDDTVYTITVTVDGNNGASLSIKKIVAESVYDGETYSEILYEVVGNTTNYGLPIGFYNEVDTGEIPYYPIIPTIVGKDTGKLNKTDHFAYIIGYPDGTVHPNGEITRAEVATIFFRLLKDEVRDAYFTSYNTYSDVSYGKWYNNPISTMSALGIINGYPDGTFRPNAPITRAEFAAIAARFDETATRGTTTFTDVYGHWAADEIAKAYGNDWIKGYPDGTFRPDRNITRAEAMALINRVLDRGPESPSDLLPDMNKWSDNMDTTKWYYLDIQEATNSHDYTRKTFNYELWKRMLLDPDWSRYER